MTIKMTTYTAAVLAAILAATLALLLTGCTSAATPEPPGNTKTAPTVGTTVSGTEAPPGETPTREDPMPIPRLELNAEPLIEPLTEPLIEITAAPTSGPTAELPEQTTGPATMPAGACEHLDARKHPEDCLDPLAHRIYQSAMELAMQGDLEGAVERTQLAQETHGGISGHLEMAQGRLLALAGEQDDAIPHFKRSIEIRNDSTHRALWAMQLLEWDRCIQAEEEAQAATQMPVHEEPGFNSHTESHQVLADCAWSKGQTELGNEHMGEAYRLARETGYDFAVPDGSPEDPG